MLLGPKPYQPTLNHHSQLADKHVSKMDYESFKGRYWSKINSETDLVGNIHTRWVFAGLYKKETSEFIYIDIHSDRLNALKKLARKECHGKNIQEILEKVNEIINDLTQQPEKSREEVEATLDQSVQQFLKSKLPAGVTIPEKNQQIELDEFIQEKILICRHKALIAAVLLADLVEQEILPFGKVSVYRSDIGHTGKEVTGAHMWANYRDLDSGHLWVCDPRWEVVQDLNQPGGDQTLIAKGYGDLTIKDLTGRINARDTLERFAINFKTHTELQKLVTTCEVRAASLELFWRHIRIEFKESTTKVMQDALQYALIQQGITVEEKEDGEKKYLIISLEKNVTLENCDFEKIVKCYHGNLTDFNTTPESPAGKEDISVIETSEESSEESVEESTEDLSEDSADETDDFVDLGTDATKIPTDLPIQATGININNLLDYGSSAICYFFAASSADSLKDKIEPKITEKHNADQQSPLKQMRS